MSVVANSPPLLKPCMNVTLPEMASRKIADTIDPSGFHPWAASSAALRTKKAARIGISLATTTSEIKPVTLVSIPRNHDPLIPAPCGGTVMPWAANQDRNCGKVSKITDHSIHLWKRPPTSKLTPLSWRRASPASTIVHIAAGTAMSNSSCSRSVRICGVVIVVPPKPQYRLLHSGCALADPELDQPGKAGDHQ